MISLSLLFFSLIGPLMGGDYSVQKGDTGTSIANKNKTPLDVLQRSNPGLNWDRLMVGDRLAVPDRYTVKAGDTLYSLCRGWGLEQAAVLSLNGMSSPTLKVGQVVYIPSTNKVPSASQISVPVEPQVSATALFWPVEKKPHSEGDRLKSVTFPTNGEPFRSVTSGVVVYSGEFRGVGRVLLVESPDKTVFAYGNFESALVSFGQSVVRGQALGITSSRLNQKLSFFAFRDTDSLDVYSVKR